MEIDGQNMVDMKLFTNKKNEPAQTIDEDRK